jgi:hypothetical protein
MLGGGLVGGLSLAVMAMPDMLLPLPVQYNPPEVVRAFTTTFPLAVKNPRLSVSCSPVTTSNNALAIIYPYILFI